MKPTSLLSLLTALAAAAAALAQGQPPKLTPEQLRRGVTLYPNPGLAGEDPCPW